MNLAFLKKQLPRRPVLIAAALVVAAGVVAGRERPAILEIESRNVQPEKTATASDIDLGKLKPAEASGAQSDPFAPRSFEPPQEAAPAPPPVKRRPPQTPPLPFAYAGKLTQDGRTEIFVKRGSELIPIAAGQNIDEQYRVDSISESEIRFTYLPLKTRQTIELESEG
jgi:hypothetical protein